MHGLWSLPAGDADFPGRWRAIKTAFAKTLPTLEPRSPAMTNRGERGIWQRRYWELTIRDDRDFAAHVDYTHFNPVKHSLVKHPADWPHSSRILLKNSGIGLACQLLALLRNWHSRNFNHLTMRACLEIRCESQKKARQSGFSTVSKTYARTAGH
jgi:hypothetical protein